MFSLTQGTPTESEPIMAKNTQVTPSTVRTWASSDEGQAAIAAFNGTDEGRKSPAPLHVGDRGRRRRVGGQGRCQACRGVHRQGRDLRREVLTPQPGQVDQTCPGCYN